MPAATSKPDLIHICDRDFARLAVLLDGLSLSEACAPDSDGWSIRDVIAHRTHWIRLALRWAREGRQGLTPEIPAPGVSWRDLKRYNLALRDASAGTCWDDARQEFRSAHIDLMREIDSHEDGALYGAPMPGGNGKWTTGRYFEAAGASHYRSASRFVRTRLRDLARGHDADPSARQPRAA